MYMYITYTQHVYCISVCIYVYSRSLPLVSSQCCVLVNVSPDLQDAAETLSTLQFGSSIRQVALGKATQNVVPAKSSRNVK